MTRLKWVRSCTVVLGLASIVAGCATSPVEDSGLPVAAPGQSQAQMKREDYQAKVARLVERNPLFALMTAEIAQQRGDAYSAMLAYLEAAKQLQDPELAKRALEISLGEGQLEEALKAAQVWADVAPTDAQARRSVMVLQLGTNRVDEALPALKTYLAQVKEAEQANPGISHATPIKVATEMLMRIPDKTKAYNTAIELFGNNPKDADAQLLLAQISESADQFATAIVHLQNLAAISPQERYVVQLAQLMERRDTNPSAALAYITPLTDQNPKWFGARLYLARVYSQQEQWPLAKQRFNEMLQLQPENYPLYSSLGFVLSKTGERKAAEKAFNVYLSKVPATERQNEALIHITMADMAAQDKDFAAAYAWLDRAPNAKTDLDIQLKKSALEELQGKPEGAARVLQQFKPANDEQAVRLALAKSQLAESRKRPQEAASELDAALSTQPNQPELLYERAMVAERMNDLSAVEGNLRKLMEVKPDNAHAYNALGYTFADRNIRLPEALTLITKAAELAPNDAFILDSLGWVHYRLGDLDKAEQALRKAYSLRQDEEIGVHLLEVLIKKGQLADAKSLSDALLPKYPDSQRLKTLIQTLPGV
ncbi:MAG: tetratricopeptide repeat protein [Limnobacter sp.]|uniref:tetratricopeptide repeat protein n=1 Tax=Limnobacter sp. TaxID=2003368 RepID=UPI00391DABF8